MFLERFGGLRRLVALTALFAAVAPASRAMAATPNDGSPRMHTVSFATKGTIVSVTTDAPTVGDFLREEGISLGDHDSVWPATDVPITEGTIVQYRSAVQVSIVVGHRQTQVWSAAPDVAGMLADNGVRTGRFDIVVPARTAPVPANGTVRVAHVTTWTTTVVTHLTPPTRHRLDGSLAPEISRVRVAGSAGTRVSIVRSLQLGSHVRHVVLSSHVTRIAVARVIADGPQAYEAYQRLREIGALDANNFATRAMQMVSMEMIATAYTANCAGCSGMTAIGRRAGHGIVAVDPRFIPIGTKLFIAGYGWAIAGDTGGAIRGSRIDLGFDTDAEAMAFGRREVTVYRLK
ncbi:MAG TPA: 3D domain-containing protein [Candidatus Tumulicola sp.]